MLLRLCAAILAVSSAAAAAPLTVPFDFSRQEIRLTVTVKGAPLAMILDTGVDPSVIDIVRAQTLGLKIDRSNAGEASGEGDAKESKVYGATLDGLAVGGRDFAAIDALAFDMSGLSKEFGSKLDGVLGWSFLKDRIFLIDYAHRELSILDRPSDAGARTALCRKHWAMPYRSFEGDTIPVIRDFRFGKATAPISLDTGSNGGISLYQSARDLPGMALTDKGETSYAGARGTGSGKLYRIDVPVGFGPFSLPKGQIAAMHPEKGSADTHQANIGNRFFAAVTPLILLDFKDRVVSFYGDCR